MASTRQDAEAQARDPGHPFPSLTDERYDEMKRSYWDHLAPLYNRIMRKDARAYDELYALIRASIEELRVLEVATGTGLIARHVADASRVMIATDYSQQMLAQARKDPCPARLTYQTADAAQLPFPDGSFDAVIISNALHIMSDPDQVLREIRRVLTGDGLLIAPTFVQGPMNLIQQFFYAILAHFTSYSWTQATYVAFLQQRGWEIVTNKTVAASFPLAYLECRPGRRC